MKLLLILLFPLAAFCQTPYKPHAIVSATGDTLWINTTKDSIFKRVSGNITFAYKPKFKNLSSQFAGGSTGQVPVKNSNTDYDWTWGNPSASASFGALTGVYSDNASLVSAFAGKQDAGSYATASHNHSGVYQPADGDLDYLAGFTPTANVKSILNAADYAAIKALLTVNNVDNTSNATERAATATLTNKTISGASNTLSNIGISSITGYTGYTLSVQALTSSPTDAQTIYFGKLPKAPTSTANISKVYIRKAGTIKVAELYCYSGTAGTNESWSIYIRVNNTTDNLIATVSASTSERIFSNTGLNISVNVGDYIEIKSVNPTWATNPLTTIFGGYIYIE